MQRTEKSIKTDSFRAGSTTQRRRHLPSIPSPGIAAAGARVTDLPTTLPALSVHSAAAVLVRTHHHAPAPATGAGMRQLRTRSDTHRGRKDEPRAGREAAVQGVEQKQVEHPHACCGHPYGADAFDGPQLQRGSETFVLLKRNAASHVCDSHEPQRPKEDCQFERLGGHRSHTETYDEMRDGRKHTSSFTNTPSAKCCSG